MVALPVLWASSAYLSISTRARRSRVGQAASTAPTYGPLTAMRCRPCTMLSTRCYCPQKLHRLQPQQVLGKAAADNCAKMKKGDLAAAAAERMAGHGWLPPALVIAEPPVEVA